MLRTDIHSLSTLVYRAVDEVAGEAFSIGENGEHLGARLGVRRNVVQQTTVIRPIPTIR